MVFLFTILLPELYPVSVLQNFMSALLTGCVTAILQMIKTSSQLMEKRSGTLMTRVAAGERFMSLVRSQQCTVWSSDRSGQIRTDEKSNEITAIPELLNMLDIKGKIITTDAMGCQKDIAEKIQKQGGDYLFAENEIRGGLIKPLRKNFH